MTNISVDEQNEETTEVKPEGVFKFVRSRVLRWVDSKRSMTALHALLNSYGTVVIRLQFETDQYQALIVQALERIGWQVDEIQTSEQGWTNRHEIVIVKSGPEMTGSIFQDRVLNAILVAVGQVPNRLVLLVPEFHVPDLVEPPKWAIDGAETEGPTSEALKLTPSYFGDFDKATEAAQRLVHNPKLIPVNSRARKQKARPVRERISLWLKVITAIPGLGLGIFFYEFLKSIFSESPILGLLFQSEQQGRATPIVLALIVILAAVLWLAYFICLLVFGGRSKKRWFSGSIFEIKALFDRDVASHLPQQRRMSVSTWPRSKAIEDRGLRVYGRTKFIFWHLYYFLFGILFGIFIRNSWDFFSRSWWQTAIVLIFFAVVFLAVGLWGASRRLQTRRLPRIVVGISAITIVGAALIRLPAWAYLNGMGLSPLTDSVDWTGLASLSPFLIAGVAGSIAYASAAIWAGRRAGPIEPLIYLLVVMMPMTIVLESISRSMTDGYNLQITGLPQYAQGNFPAAACIQKTANPSTPSASEPGATAKPVWIIAVREQYLSVTDRAESTEPLANPGIAKSLPVADYTISYVRYEKEGDMSKPVLRCDELSK